MRREGVKRAREKDNEIEIERGNLGGNAREKERQRREQIKGKQREKTEERLNLSVFEREMERGLGG